MTVATRAPITVKKTRNCETGALVKPEEIIALVEREGCKYACALLKGVGAVVRGYNGDEWEWIGGDVDDVDVCGG